jgi:hypothetical protein
MEARPVGLGLNPKRVGNPTSDDARREVRVQDAFDIRPSYGLDHEPGVVLVLDSFVVEDPQAWIGTVTRVRTPSGRAWHVVIDDIRDHGTTISLFVKNLTREDLPVGSTVEMEG